MSDAELDQNLLFGLFNPNTIKLYSLPKGQTLTESGGSWILTKTMPHAADDTEGAWAGGRVCELGQVAYQPRTSSPHL